MKKEVKESLKHLEYSFYTSINNGWHRVLSNKDKDLISQLYKELTGKDCKMRCNKCSVEAMKVVGEEYYKEDIELEYYNIIEYGNTGGIESEIQSGSELVDEELSEEDYQTDDRDSVGFEE